MLGGSIKRLSAHEGNGKPILKELEIKLFGGHTACLAEGKNNTANIVAPHMEGEDIGGKLNERGCAALVGAIVNELGRKSYSRNLVNN